MIFTLVLIGVLLIIFVIDFCMWMFVVKTIREVLKMAENSDIIQITKKKN